MARRRTAALSLASPPAEEWRALAIACARAVDGEEEQLLRRTVAVNNPGRQPEDRVEALIEAGAWESAALALLPPDTAWMLSRSPDGHHIATVVLAEWPHEVNAEGPSLALALIAALVEARANALARAGVLLN